MHALISCAQQIFLYKESIEKMKSDDYKTLIGSVVIWFLLAGAPRTASLFYVESLSRFDTNRREASFPFVLFYLVRHLSGPLVGYLEQIFGLKYVVLFGAILATISVGACFFAEDVLAVTILWGGLSGLGIGMASHLLPSLLNYQFPKHRSKANSFAYSGVCLGLFVLSPIVEMCIDWYGFSGSLLILSAIMAHSIPAALMLKNIDNDIPFDDKEKLDQNINKETIKGIDLNIKPYDSCKDVKILNNDENFSKKDSKNIVIFQIESDSKICSKETIEQSSKSTVKEDQISKKGNFSLSRFSVLLDPAYIIIMILHAGYLFVLIIIWTIILDFLRDKGIPQRLEIYYLMLLPVADFVGRFGSGYFIDKHYMATSTATSIANFLIGVLLIAFIFSYNYIILMFSIGLISIVQGSMIILQVSLTHESIEAEKRTLAMTSRYILYAPFCLFSSPMIGFFRGTQGSYDNVFYILSGISLFCGFVTCLIPQIVKRRTITS